MAAAISACVRNAERDYGFELVVVKLQVHDPAASWQSQRRLRECRRWCRRPGGEVVRKPPQQGVRRVGGHRPQLEDPVEEERADHRPRSQLQPRQGEASRATLRAQAAPDSKRLSEVARGVGALQRRHFPGREIGRRRQSGGGVVTVEQRVAGALAGDILRAGVA